jgi:hypothetical protein
VIGPFVRRSLSWWPVLLAVALVLSPSWSSARVFYHRDVLGYWYPGMEVVRRLATQGVWPWWNPFVAFGTPLLADPNFQLAYPPTWLVLLMPPALYFKLYVVGHCCLAGLATRGLTLRLGGSRYAATLAGITFACSGPLLSSVSLFHHFAGAAWMPAVLWAFRVALDAGTTGPALRLGAVAALQALAGSADLCAMTALACLQVAALGPADPPAWRGRLRALVRVAAVAPPVAAALGAVQWLPALALVADSARPSLSQAARLFWSLHPARLIEGLVPRLLSDTPLSAAARAALFESREPLLASVYLGVPALLLAVLGAACGVSWGRRSGIGFACFLLLALGRHTPLLPVLLRVPPFGMFRFPEKYMLPASLFLAILAGRGADAWLSGWTVRERRRAALLALGCLALVIGLLLLASWAATLPEAFGRMLPPDAAASGKAVVLPVQRLRLSAFLLLACAALLLLRERSGWARPTLLAIGLGLGLDLALVGRSVNPLAPVAILSYRPPVLSAIDADPADTRVLSYPEDYSSLQEQFTGEGWRGADARVAWAVGFLDRLSAPGAALFEVRGSYDGDFSGLASPALSAMGVIRHQFESTPLGPRLLRMGNVGWVVGLEGKELGLADAGSFPSVFRVPVRLFRVPDPLPVAYVVDGISVAAEPRSYEVMAAPSFDPRRVAIVAEGMENRTPTRGFHGEARVISRRADRVVVDAELSGPGLVVLVEAWRRGWSVQVDGQPAPLLRANVLFRAAAVPAGRHTVCFRYFPPLLGAGAAVSMAALLGLSLALARSRRDASRVERNLPETLASGRDRGEVE